MSTVKTPTINHRISNSVDVKESARTGAPVTGLCGISFVIREQEPGDVVARTAGKAYRCFTCEYRFEALTAGLPIPYAGEPEAPVWKDWEIHDFAWLLIEAAYGDINVVDSLPAGTLGEWSWVRRGRGKPQITLKVSRTPHPGGHWSRSAQLAHMLLHIEEGSQCQGSDPGQWTVYEHELEARAMQRLGLARWDIRTITGSEVHGANESLLLRSTTPALVGAGRL
jgi:hypothetical protein